MLNVEVERRSGQYRVWRVLTDGFCELRAQSRLLDDPRVPLTGTHAEVPPIFVRFPSEEAAPLDTELPIGQTGVTMSLAMYLSSCQWCQGAPAETPLPARGEEWAGAAWPTDA